MEMHLDEMKESSHGYRNNKHFQILKSFSVTIKIIITSNKLQKITLIHFFKFPLGYKQKHYHECLLIDILTSCYSQNYLNELFITYSILLKLNF